MSQNLIMVQKEDLWEFFKEVMNMYFGGEPANRLDPQTEKKYYTRDEVCAHLHITLSTLWRKEKNGEIKARKVGRRNLYLKSDVEGLIDKEPTCPRNVNCMKEFAYR